MKKTINKLSLNKSTISNLSHSALDQINGGANQPNAFQILLTLVAHWPAQQDVRPELVAQA